MTKGKPTLAWTPTELLYVEAAALDGIRGYYDLAEMTGRSVEAIKRTATRYGIRRPDQRNYNVRAQRSEPPPVLARPIWKPAPPAPNPPIPEPPKPSMEPSIIRPWTPAERMIGRRIP